MIDLEEDEYRGIDIARYEEEGSKENILFPHPQNAAKVIHYFEID